MKKSIQLKTFKSLTPLRRRQYIRIAGATAVFCVAAFLARKNLELTGIEADISVAIYNLPTALMWPASIITQLGSVWFALMLIIALMLWHHYRLALRLSLAMAIAFVLTEVMKVAVDRPRPPDLIETIISREPLTFSHGFPSGHTAVIVALVLVVWPVLKPAHRQLAILAVVLVPLTRIYLGVHSPLDIIGGACIGIVAATTIQMVRKVLPGIHAK